MASSGTLLSDLNEPTGGSNDTDLVKKIFADMNMNSQANPLMGGGGGGQMIMSPNPNTMTQMTMDSVPATSHIIGKDHPTPADFAAAIHGVPRTADPSMSLPPPMPGNMMMPNQGYAPYMNQMPQQQQMPTMYEEPKKNMYAKVADELKTPIFVAILVFVFSLPFINLLFSHYIPSLVKPTGDLTSVGLLVKSVFAGATFWILQRVIAPLVSL